MYVSILTTLKLHNLEVNVTVQWMNKECLGILKVIFHAFDWSKILKITEPQENISPCLNHYTDSPGYAIGLLIFRRRIFFLIFAHPVFKM